MRGGNLRGFHHHATLCIAAGGLLLLDREPLLPEGFRPRGSGADAAPRTRFDRHCALLRRARHRAYASSVSMLRGREADVPKKAP